jgi:hypothetical protein
MKSLKCIQSAIIGSVLLLGICHAVADAADGNKDPMDLRELASRWEKPDSMARPWVYWNWMNGNISKQGITSDLEAMSSVGVGGVMMFNIGDMVPDGPIRYRSDKWFDLLRHAVKTANELNISFVIHNCDGWSTSGGPWVTKANAMKELVFSEIKLESGKSFTGPLPMPPRKLGYYQDIVYLAFPTPAKEIRIPGINQKAGFSKNYDVTRGTETVPDEAMIDSSQILNLSDRVSAQGILNWVAPEGKDWTVLRIGYSLRSGQNGPATPEGRGLECDKLSREAMSEHWKYGIQTILERLGDSTLDGVLFDSYETSGGNWTAKMPEEFASRRRYDLIRWLPALTGRYIDSVQGTESFLSDFRRTIADLFEDNYVHYAAKLAKTDGLKIYMEPYEGPFDSLQVGADASMVMGECWTTLRMIHWNKVASSSAHVNGLKLTGSEIFTADAFHGRWQGHPRKLKSIGDRVWSEGVNKFVFHVYAHQPWENIRPGQSLGPYGTHFNRMNTWWKQSKAWVSYITRAQQVLQAGRFVADIALIAEEEMPSHGSYRPDIKLKGYDYDMVSAKKFAEFEYLNNEFILPSGARYKALIIPESDYLSLNTLIKIKKLTDAGATVVARKPKGTPTLTDKSKLESYSQLLAKLFDNNHQSSGASELKGKVIWRNEIKETMEALQILPDFEVGNKEMNIVWIHRAVNQDQIYFVGSQEKVPIQTKAKFRVGAGHSAEIWKPQTGEILKIPLSCTKDGRAILDLNFEPEESCFVVFKEGGDSDTDQFVSISKLGGQGSSKATTIPTLEIKSAEFGIFEIVYPDTVDVRKAVAKELTSDNGLSVLCGNHLGGDSAPGHMKSLWVEYRQGGKVLKASTALRKSLVIPPSNKPIEILRAFYGRIPNDESRLPNYESVDVTHQVKSLLDKGLLNFKTGTLFKNKAVGDVPRQLKISYSENGVDKELIVGMEDRVSLPQESWRALHPSPQLADIGGKMLARLWEGGQYELESRSGKRKTLKVDDLPEDQLIDGSWKVTFPSIQNKDQQLVFDRLHSYAEDKNEAVKHFSGTAVYHKEIEVSERRFLKDQEIWLSLGQVEVIAEVEVNGKSLGTFWKEPYMVNLTGHVTPGSNQITVRLTNLLVNRLIGDARYPDEVNYVGGRASKNPDWIYDPSAKRKSQRETFSVSKLWDRDDELVKSGLLGPVVLKSSKLVDCGLIVN